MLSHNNNTNNSNNNNNNNNKNNAIDKIAGINLEICDSGGGSIVIIVKDIDSKSRVYKILTKYESDINNIQVEILNYNKTIRNDILIYELLSKNIIKKNISDHVVKYNRNYEISGSNLYDLFINNKEKYTLFMKILRDKKQRTCNNYFYGNIHTKFSNTYNIMELEYCDYSCNMFMMDIIKLSEMEIKLYLDIFLFQIVYTILVIRERYPLFMHNDLFMRNILGNKIDNNNNNKYLIYNFGEKTYYVPEKIFNPKINDFGLSNIYNKNEIVSEYKDIYDLIIDIYNGGNFYDSKHGLVYVLNNMDFLNGYFSNFFDVDMVSGYRDKTKRYNFLDKNQVSILKLRNPYDLMDNYFYGLFG